MPKIPTVGGTSLRMDLLIFLLTLLLKIQMDGGSSKTARSILTIPALPITNMAPGIATTEKLTFMLTVSCMEHITIRLPGDL